MQQNKVRCLMDRSSGANEEKAFSFNISSLFLLLSAEKSASLCYLRVLARYSGMSTDSVKNQSKGRASYYAIWIFVFRIYS